MVVEKQVKLVETVVEMEFGPVRPIGIKGMEETLVALAVVIDLSKACLHAFEKPLIRFDHEEAGVEVGPVGMPAEHAAGVHRAHVGAVEKFIDVRADQHIGIEIDGFAELGLLEDPEFREDMDPPCFMDHGAFRDRDGFDLFGRDAADMQFVKRCRADLGGDEGEEGQGGSALAQGVVEDEQTREEIVRGDETQISAIVHDGGRVMDGSAGSGRRSRGPGGYGHLLAETFIELRISSMVSSVTCP